MLDAYAERWALITGASSGIGAEFARRLAGRGMHLVLTARREDKLRELAAELDTQHGTRCEVIPCDLSEVGSSNWLMEQIAARGVEVELLINNAGFGVVSDIENTDPQRVQQLVRLNIATLTDLTYAVLPGMLERRHGAVINVSSVAAFQPVAYMAAYAASKAYVLHFSEALWAEVRDRGVTVLGLCPGPTETDFFASAGVPDWLNKHTPDSPTKVVKTAVKALEKRKQYVITGWKNYFWSIAVRLATRRTAVNEARKYFRPKKNKDQAESDGVQAEDTTASTDDEASMPSSDENAA